MITDFVIMVQAVQQYQIRKKTAAILSRYVLIFNFQGRRYIQANHIRTFCSKPKLKSLPGRIFLQKKSTKKATYLSTENKTLHYLIFVKCIYRLFHVKGWKRLISMFPCTLCSAHCLFFKSFFGWPIRTRTSADIACLCCHWTSSPSRRSLGSDWPKRVTSGNSFVLIGRLRRSSHVIPTHHIFSIRDLF